MRSRKNNNNEEQEEEEEEEDRCSLDASEICRRSLTLAAPSNQRRGSSVSGMRLVMWLSSEIHPRRNSTESPDTLTREPLTQVSPSRVLLISVRSWRPRTAVTHQNPAEQLLEQRR